MSTDVTTDDVRNNFDEFFALVFDHTHPDKDLEFAPYLRCVLDRYQNLEAGDRIIFNQPPRTLKSWTAKAYAAWYLGHNPSANVMIVSATLKLAETIAYDIRRILRSKFYQKLFPNLKIAPDRSKVDQLMTTAGGGILALSVDGAVAGYGADLLILDDPNKIDDESKPDRLDAVNNKFDTAIISRLNSRKKGVVVVIQHRLNKNDLSGHLLESGDYIHVAFPLVAPRKKRYRLSNGEVWVREKNDVLVPNAYSKRDIKDAKKSVSPSFYWFYQQGFGSDANVRIEVADFKLLENPEFIGPAVISIDTAQRKNTEGSFNVIQVWRETKETYHLIEQFRERCDYQDLERQAISLINKYQPAAILIENSAQGPALISCLSLKFKKSNFLPVEPRGSKLERLERHRTLIRRGEISLSIRKVGFDFMIEFNNFPKGDTDQIDATTQYLDFMATRPVLKAPEPRALAAVGFHSSGQIHSGPSMLRPTARPVGLALGSDYRRPYGKGW